MDVEAAIVGGGGGAVGVVAVAGSDGAVFGGDGGDGAEVVQDGGVVVAGAVQGEGGAGDVAFDVGLGGAVGVVGLQPRLAVLVGAAPDELVAGRGGQFALARAGVHVAAGGAVHGGLGHLPGRGVGGGGAAGGGGPVAGRGVPGPGGGVRR